MSRPLRNLIFFTFFLAFAISAPLLVFYTAGYRIDWDHGRVVQTSILNISSEPRGATVVIDDKPYSDKTPSLIDTVLPGEHLVRLELDGYLPWEHTLSFDSSVATIRGPITLFADTEPQLLKAFGAVTHLINPDRTLLAYASQESSWMEIWVTDGSAEHRNLLMRLPFEEEASYELDWSPSGEYLLLAKQQEDNLSLHVAHAQTGAIDLPDTLSYADYWWDVGAQDLLVLRSEDGLMRYELSSQQTTSINTDVQTVRQWGTQDVTIVESNNRTILSFQEEEVATIITYLPLSTYDFVAAPDGLIGLYDTQRERLVIVDAENLTQPILLNEPASVWDWNESGTELLYSSGFDLKLYSRSSHESRTLTRLSASIDTVSWYDSQSVALYQTAGSLKAIQLQGLEPLTQTTLTSEATMDIWFSSNGKRLYILQQLEDGTYQIYSRVLQT